MKKYGHTGTLFLQSGKYYKWSYKYDHCQECGNCDHKHKGRGLCVSCFDKERGKRPKRKAQKKSILKAWRAKNYKKTVTFKPICYYKKRLFKILNSGERWKQIRSKVQRRFYERNKLAMQLVNKVVRRQKKGLPCLMVIINGKDRYMPFRDLEKPKTVTSVHYDEWKEKSRQFDILTKFYN